jgi:hypothetical protein
VRRSAPDLAGAWRRLPPFARLGVVVAPIVAVAVVLALVLSGGGGVTTPKATRAAQTARRTFCHDLSVLQDLGRADAISRFGIKVKRDVGLYRKAHDAASVRALVRIQAAAAQLHTALQRNTAIGPATTRLQQAVAAGPRC